jgi:hypothetical protein
MRRCRQICAFAAFDFDSEAGGAIADEICRHVVAQIYRMGSYTIFGKCSMVVQGILFTQLKLIDCR